MLINKERLIELLDHENPNVRNESIKALASFFKGSSNVIAPIIGAIDKYKEDSLSLVARIKFFIPNDEEIAELIRLFNETDPEESDQSMNRHYHLQQSLLHFPVKVLTDNEKTIRFNEDLSQTMDIALSREKVKAQNPDVLWDTMKDICTQFNNKEMDREASQHVWLLSQGLLRHREQIKHKIIMHLSQETEVDYHLEDILVSMAGDLKIEETVPFLFKLFKATDFMHLVHDKCIQSLGKIGGSQVVKTIEADWHNEELRSEYSSILRRLPFDYSEDLLIRCLDQESKVEIKTFLCGALCDIFSLKGAEKVLEVVKKEEYDPQISHLWDYVVPVFIYHGKEIDDMDVIQEKQDEYIKSKRESDPLYKASEGLRKTFDKIQKQHERDKAKKKKLQRK
ncbi:hypothetical protein KKA14_00540, partial [bacterium]|nr:hypothetical protein [bacterium]